ncbi:MAG: DUF3891 family protein [Cyclobacteriaceae bacterium]
MIVSHTEHGWDIIFQRAHALLAAQIALRWKPEDRPEHWPDLVAAIANHDDGQRDWEGENHLTEDGAPKDFSYQEPDLVQARRVVDNARYRSRWIAYLTSKHTSTLYEGWRGQSAEIDTFLDEQRHYQQKLIKDLKSSTKEAEAYYRLMFFCDALSLVLCKEEVPAGGNKLEVAELPDKRKATVFYTSEDVMSLQPWPFEQAQFSLSVEVYHLDRLAFQDDGELYEAFDRAAISLRQWKFSSED